MEKRFRIPVGSSFWVYSTPIEERHKAARSGLTEKVAIYSESENVTDRWLSRFTDADEKQAKQEKYIVFKLPPNNLDYTFIVFHNDAIEPI